MQQKCVESVVFGHFVLLCIDLLRQLLIEANHLRLHLSARLRLLVLVQLKLGLELVFESHDHVKTISIVNLEDKKVCPVLRFPDCNRTSQDPLFIHVCLIDQTL